MASCPDIKYQETKGVVAPGDSVLLYSDGLVEAHDPAQAMYGFPRLAREMAVDDAGSELLDRLLETLHAFTGPDWEQEDDITLVTLRRASGVADAPSGGSTLLTQFEVPGEEGNERLVMDRVAAAVADLGLDPARLERLKTAVSEAAMNAIEYGSQGRPEIPVAIAVETSAAGDRRPHHGPGPVRSGALGCGSARHRCEARRPPEAARMGPVPHPGDGRRDGRDDRWDDPDRLTDPGPRGACVMEPTEFTATVEDASDETRIHCIGDLNGRADAAFEQAYAEAGALGHDRITLDFERCGYINSTGIALVVRLLAVGSSGRTHGPGCRADPPLPTDLRDHPPGGLHGDPRGRPDRRGEHDRWGGRMTAMTILVSRSGEAGVLHISGDITSGSEADLMKAYTQATDAGASVIVLDFSGLEYMNSGGIGLMVTLLVRAQRAGQRLMAVGLSDHYRQILSLTRLDEAIEIHDTEAAAVAAAAS